MIIALLRGCDFARSLIRPTIAGYNGPLYGSGEASLCSARLARDRHEQTEASPMLEVGTAAPYFTLKSHENEEVTLSSFKGDKWVVLHTFPAAFTGG